MTTHGTTGAIEMITGHSVKSLATMNADMARMLVGQINQKAREIGAMLIALRDQEGWRALGYQSWTAFLESDELTYSRNRCLEFVRAFPVTMSVREELKIELKVEHALTLEHFPAPLQVPIAKIAFDRYGESKVTSDRLQAIGNKVTELYSTGGRVTLASGQQSAFEAAVKDERREQETTKHAAKNLLDMTAYIARRFTQEDGDYLVFRVGKGMAANLTTLRNVRLVLKPLEAA